MSAAIITEVEKNFKKLKIPLQKTVSPVTSRPLNKTLTTVCSRRGNDGLCHSSKTKRVANLAHLRRQ